MARVIHNGEPGDEWTNGTDKVQFQLFVAWANSCGLCAQYDHAIGPWWPIPFHRGCRCKQVAVVPGAKAAPFVDFREEIKALAPEQQSRVIGKAALALVEKGVVQWSDVVTKSRIRTLAEVVSREKLTVEAMTKAGVVTRIAERAYGRVNTPAHEQAQAVRTKAVETLRELGVGRAEVLRAFGERAAARVVVPGEPAAPTPAPPARTPEPAPYGPSRATVEIQQKPLVDAASRQIFGRELSATEWASLAGAPHAAGVTVRADRMGGRVIAEWTTPEGVTAERILSRPGDTPVIVNWNLEVPKDLQGQGLGAEVFGRQVEAAAAAGVGKLVTEAARDAAKNGYDTWPKFGYDAEIPWHRLPDPPKALAGLKRIRDLMATPEGRAWWAENGVTTAMEFDPAEGSYSRAAWEAYRRAKATLPTSPAATSP